MAKALTVFNPDMMPAHIAEAQQDGPGNIVNAISVDKLTYQNKIWAVNVEGTKTAIMMTNDEGDEMPRPFIPVIIVDYAKKRGRSYFLGGFDPKKVASPVCWSEDGVAPDAKAPGTPKINAEGEVDPVNGVRVDACANCPMSVKGSKIDERNKETYACASHRRLVVALRGQPDFPLLQLQIGITADYDATSTGLAEKNIFAFTQYQKYLTSKGIKYTSSVVTRLRFDTTDGVTWPKVMFEPIGYATPDEQSLYKPMAGTPEIEAILHPAYDGSAAQAALPSPEMTEAPIEGPVVIQKKPAATTKAPVAATKPKAPVAAPVAAKGPTVVARKPAPPPPPPEPEVVEEVVEYVDEDGNPCDADGNPLLDAEPEDGATEGEAGTEVETEAETPGQQKAREAQEKILADQARKNAAAKVAAGARRNAAAAGAGDEGDGGDTITITKPVAANKPKATVSVVAKAGTAVGGAATPAAGVKPAGAKTAAMLKDWTD